MSENHTSIGIIQLTRIGDVIQTFQAAKQLKTENPQVELTLIARKEFAKGLEFLLESAKFKYEFAPFGLCVSLSTEKPILDLQEAYAWCYVAQKIGNKYSNMASQRSDEILGKILLDSGVVAVEKAKKLAISRY